MDSTFWNLFWSTGMPEAWLMSRGPAQHPGNVPDGAGQRMPGLTVGVQLPITGTTPADPRGIV